VLLRIAPVLLLPVIAPAAPAQARFGFHAGTNFASFGGPDGTGLESRHGVHGGLFLNLPFSSRFSTRLGLSYTQKGAEQSGPDTDTRYSFSYFQVPLTARFMFVSTERIALHAVGGAAFGVNIVCERLEASFTSRRVIACDSPEPVPHFSAKRTDVGAILGAGITLQPHGAAAYTIEATYEHGLSYLDKSPLAADIRNQVIALSFAVSFRLSQQPR
jgi:hypothetical protein